jgi:hypothetical protein
MRWMWGPLRLPRAGIGAVGAEDVDEVDVGAFTAALVPGIGAVGAGDVDEVDVGAFTAALVLARASARPPHPRPHPAPCPYRLRSRPTAQFFNHTSASPK